MIREEAMIVGDREYRRNPEVDRFQVPLQELGNMRLGEIPSRSHLEVIDLPGPSEFTFELYVVNQCDDYDSLFTAYGGADAQAQADAARALSRLRRAFPHNYGGGFFPNPLIGTIMFDGEEHAHAHLSLEYRNASQKPIREAIDPFIAGFASLARPEATVFICHASEDKDQARQLATFLAQTGASVWFDEWEIRVGDSLVGKIGEALQKATHIIVLLSKNSISKPWVTKELSTALMRTMANNSVRLLPLRLDDSPVPPLLAELRYANGSAGISKVFPEIERAIFEAERNL